MNVLNLLTTYQKKQIVEFLSYHECDASSNHEPDLNCLVKLQAQNIRQRHLIYLTGDFLSLYVSKRNHKSVFVLYIILYIVYSICIGALTKRFTDWFLCIN